MSQVVTIGAKFVAAAIWAIIGLIFWIPMICRIFFLQISLLIMSAFSNKSNSNIDGMLNKAINFYSDGFSRIFSDYKGEEIDRVFNVDDLIKFIPMMLFTIGFYVSTLIFYFSLRFIF